MDDQELKQDIRQISVTLSWLWVLALGWSAILVIWFVLSLFW